MKLRRRSISLEDDVWTKIISLANTCDRSTSDYVRLVLREHLKNIGVKPKKKEK